MKGLNLPTVKSETVFKADLDLINEKELPWCNLMGVLMDTCSVMRGSKNGFEIKLRESVAPAHSCHHIYNACKKFTTEQLYQDTYNDFKWSEDIRVILKDICEWLSVTYRRPEMFIATRCLSVYDVTHSTIYMFDVYAIFYFSFLRKEDKKLCKSMLNAIYSYHILSDEETNQNELKRIETEQINEGRKRKKR